MQLTHYLNENKNVLVYDHTLHINILSSQNMGENIQPDDFTYALESANYNTCNRYLSLHNQNLNVQSIYLTMKT